MSSQAGGGASSQAHTNGRQKKNSFGSWFSKKFGKKGSEGGGHSQESSAANYAAANGTVPARKGPTKASDDRKNATLASANGGAVNGGAQQPQFAAAFTSNQAHGLANTLTVPNTEGPANGRLTPPPQLDGIPTSEPLGAIDLPRSPRPDSGSVLTPQVPGTLSPSTITNERPLEPVAPGVNEHGLHPEASTSHNADPALVPAAAIPGAIVSNAPLVSNHTSEVDSDNESSFTGRDSIGNRTMDTSKSRASTKPTTLMSLDTREPTVLPTTHIAQPRNVDGDDSFRASQRLSTGPRDGSVIHFAPDSVSRSGSGQIAGNGGIVNEGGSNFINVPTHSRPHPNNNPHPSGIPADNASVLTLASSTAGMSLGGASRSQHQAPSFGGARSIGGSLMGDRRNSSDTYASLKALPPLSRRGSDSSSRTRESVAASSTGQNSHQAMYAATGSSAGPGAPTDRVSLHRTPSQKTIATQLSVPISTSASNAALQADAKAEPATNSSQSHVAAAALGGASQTGHATAEPVIESRSTEANAAGGEAHLENLAVAEAVVAKESAETPFVAPSHLPTIEAPAEGLLEAQASNLAATEHDKTLQDAAATAAQSSAHTTGAAAAAASGEEGNVLPLKEQEQEQEPFDVPGGPPVA